MNSQTAALPQAFSDFLAKVNLYIINPVIILLFALAAVAFAWGAFKYIANADNETERRKGGMGILYGIIGMFIMFSVFGLINLISGTLAGLGLFK